MYVAAGDYYRMCKSQIRTFEIHGNVYNEAGTEPEYPISGNNILQGSFSFTNQLCDSRAVTVGGVYMGQMNMTLIGNFPRDIVGREIVMKQQISAESQDDEVLTLGHWIIKDALWTKKTLVLTCYDLMCKLDKDIPQEFFSEYGNTRLPAYDVLGLIRDNCGITLAQSRETIETYPNGAEWMYWYFNSDDETVTTWRDLLSHVAAALASFATFNRFGKLTLRRFGACKKTAYDDEQQAMVDTEYTQNAACEIITADERISGGTFGNSRMRFTAVSYDNLEEGEKEYSILLPNNGQIMDLGANVFLQELPADELVNLAENIRDEVTQYVTYYGAKIQLPDVSMYDLGDIIRLYHGGELDGETNPIMCVMKIDYTFGRGGWIECFFDDSHGMVKSKAQRAAGTSSRNSASTSSLTSSQIDFILPTAQSTAAISDGDTGTVLTFSFQTTGDKAAFFCTLGLTIDTTAVTDTSYGDCAVTVTYELDGVTVGSLTQTYGDGAQILTLSYLLQGLDTSSHVFSVSLSPVGGDIS